jgi:hypothetical protein
MVPPATCLPQHQQCRACFPRPIDLVLPDGQRRPVTAFLAAPTVSWRARLGLPVLRLTQHLRKIIKPPRHIFLERSRDGHRQPIDRIGGEYQTVGSDFLISGERRSSGFF